MQHYPKPATPTSVDPDPPCPLRPGGACALCVPGASGPDNCGLVYLVMTDPELRTLLDRLQSERAPGNRIAAGGRVGA